MAENISHAKPIQQNQHSPLLDSTLVWLKMYPPNTPRIDYHNWNPTVLTHFIHWYPRQLTNEKTTAFARELTTAWVETSRLKWRLINASVFHSHRQKRVTQLAGRQGMYRDEPNGTETEQKRDEIFIIRTDMGYDWQMAINRTTSREASNNCGWLTYVVMVMHMG